MNLTTNSINSDFSNFENIISVNGVINEDNTTYLNMSSIYSLMITEAAKNENYASDILYEIDIIKNALEKRQNLSRLICFRTLGVDSYDFLKVNDTKIYSDYRTIWCIDINFKSNKCITVEIAKVI